MREVRDFLGAGLESGMWPLRSLDHGWLIHRVSPDRLINPIVLQNPTWKRLHFKLRVIAVSVAALCLGA
ncbi:hypothetical protein CDEF62S_05495 [Castellaniella defragrans]